MYKECKDKLIFLKFLCLSSPHPPSPPHPHPHHSPSVRGNKIKIKKTHVELTFCTLCGVFVLSIWSFTVCYQVTEAWLAPFVCGSLFCPVPYMEDRGGAVWWVEPHPLKRNYNLIFCVFRLDPEAELEHKSLNFSSSQENGIMCPVY